MTALYVGNYSLKKYIVVLGTDDPEILQNTSAYFC